MAVSAGPWVFTVLGCILCSLWTWYQLRYYARKDTPKPYFAAVFVSWWLGIVAVIVLLPMDIAAAKYGDEYINSDDPSSAHFFVQTLWRFDYWITFIWCWVVCPIVMEYWAAGEFTPRSRLKTAVKHNIKFYSYAVLAVLIIGVFVGISKGFGPTRIAGYLIAAANCYGMLLIVLMIGYGIVEVPRSLWTRAHPERQLKHLEFSAPLVQSAMLDAKCDLEDTIRSIYAFQTKLNNTRSGIVSPDLEGYLRIVIDKATMASETSSALASGSSIQVDEVPLTTEGLAELHYRLKANIVMYQRALYEWETLLDRSLELENEVASNQAGDGYRRLTSPSIDSGSAPTHRFFFPFLHNAYTIALTGKTWIIFTKVAALICLVLSLILLWCECVSPINENLSIFGLLLHSAQTAGLAQLYSFLPLAYMATCAYIALFKFKYLRKLSLHGNGQTDVYCLLYNACYFGRLQFSLGVNYFSMLQKQDARNTAFGALVGDMDVVPFLGTSFNNYIPLVIVFLAFCTVIRAIDRILNKLGIETRTDPQVGNVAHDEKISEGKNLILRTRTRRMQRLARESQRNGGRNNANLNIA